MSSVTSYCEPPDDRRYQGRERDRAATERRDVLLLVRFRDGSTRLVSGRVTTAAHSRAVVVTAAGERVELLEDEIKTLFHLPVD